MLRQRLTSPTIKGFEHINRYWDPRMRQPTAKILPGECYVSKTGEMIVTVLGSCIAACIRDTRLGIGGMNHFMLPVQKNDPAKSAITSELAYGNWAMEFLVNEILKLGGKKSSLEVKIFGGGQVLSAISNIDVGARNIDFVTKFIANEGMSIKAQDVGSTCPRKVLYFPDTGSVKLKRLRTTANDTIQKRELEYIETMRKKPDQGEVELF